MGSHTKKQIMRSMQMLHGIKMENARPCLDDEEETRYIYNNTDFAWYFNNETEAIELRINNEEV